MTLNTISVSGMPVSPGTAPTSATCAAPPATAAAAAPPALLTSKQLMAALGLSRRRLKKWNRHRVIPSAGRGHARRYDLAQVLEALRAHGQPDAAAASAPGMGGPAGLPDDI